MKKTAVRFNLPGTSEKKKKLSLEREARRQRRSNLVSSSLEPLSEIEMECENDLSALIIDNNEQAVDDTMENIAGDQDVDSTAPGDQGVDSTAPGDQGVDSTAPVMSITGSNMQDAVVQIVPRFHIKDDIELKITTGLESFLILDCIVELVELAVTKKTDQADTKMSFKNQVILTYMRLKMNLPYNFLAMLFNCNSNDQCKQIFKNIFNILKENLSVETLRQPNKEVLMQHI